MSEFESTGGGLAVVSTVAPIISTVKAAVDALVLFNKLVATQVEIVGQTITRVTNPRDTSSIGGSITKLTNQISIHKVWVARELPSSTSDTRTWEDSIALLAKSISTGLSLDMDSFSGILLLASSPSRASLVSSSTTLAKMTGATAVLSGQVFEDVPQRLDLSNQRCPRLRQEQLHSTFPALGRINQSLSQVRKIIETGDGSTNAVRNISRTVSSRIDELSNLSSRLEDFTTESVPDLKKLTLTGVSTNYDAIVEELNSAQNAPSSSDFVCWIVIIGNPDNFSLVSALL